MAFSLTHFVGMSCIGFMAIALCMATIQSVKTKFTEGKKPLTSYTTLQRISKIQCVERCSKEKQTGGCTLAGYNKATKTCYLSVDDAQDVLDTTDEMFGVFFYKPDQTGRFHVMLWSNIKMLNLASIKGIISVKTAIYTISFYRLRSAASRCKRDNCCVLHYTAGINSKVHVRCWLWDQRSRSNQLSLFWMGGRTAMCHRC